MVCGVVTVRAADRPIAALCDALLVRCPNRRYGCGLDMPR
eukprot:gene40150-24149_t